ncbi:MAG: glycosyltransferase [Treponema sp.]|nr:glycosyltransferase [Treponema sp.]
MGGYILNFVIEGLIQFILWYVVGMALINILQIFSALFIVPEHRIKTHYHEYRHKGEHMAPISILVPAFNEEANIVESIKVMLNQYYLNYEVLVINDDSDDKTLEVMMKAFNLHKITYPVREQLATKKIRGVYYNPDIPRLRLVDKERGGKSDALNVGINLSRYPYILSVDTNTILEPSALINIAMDFMYHDTVSVGGMIRVANGCTIEDGRVANIGLPRNIWALFQVIEYIRGWTGFSSQLLISSAFGAFQKSAVLQVGGYTAGAVGEDMDLVVKLHRHLRRKKIKYRMSFLPDPVCWKRVPEKLGDLFLQRRKRQTGLISILSRYREMFLNPRFGIPGMLALPYYFLFAVISPWIKVTGYIAIPLAWYFGRLSLEGLILFFAAATVFGIIASIGSLLIEEASNPRFTNLRDGLFLCLLSIFENLFYRQMTVVFRLLGFIFHHKQRITEKKQK